MRRVFPKMVLVITTSDIKQKVPKTDPVLFWISLLLIPILPHENHSGHKISLQPNEMNNFSSIVKRQICVSSFHILSR